jgi:hypothetical protein
MYLRAVGGVCGIGWGYEISSVWEGAVLVIDRLGGHVRNEMCLLISMFLGYEYIIPIKHRFNYRLRIIYA